VSRNLGVASSRGPGTDIALLAAKEVPGCVSVPPFAEFQGRLYKSEYFPYPFPPVRFLSPQPQRAGGNRTRSGEEISSEWVGDKTQNADTDKYFAGVLM